MIIVDYRYNVVQQIPRVNSFCLTETLCSLITVKKNTLNKYTLILLKEHLSKFHVPYLELDGLFSTFITMLSLSVSQCLSLSLQIEISQFLSQTKIVQRIQNALLS